MKDPTGNPVYGKTRWRRFMIILGPAFGVVALMVYLVATGVIAVSFAMSGIPFKLSASNLSGDNFVQYATVDPVTNNTSGALLPAASTQSVGGTTYDAVTITVLGSASIANLHQTVCAPIPAPLGTVLPHNKLLVTIDAGGGGSPATATNLVVDAPLLNASDATFTNIDIGRDLGNALGGANNGSFSQAATHVSINNLVQLAIGTSAGTFVLNGLTLSATFVDTCP
jgi:hypothetical protein